MIDRDGKDDDLLQYRAGIWVSIADGNNNVRTLIWYESVEKCVRVKRIDCIDVEEGL